MPALIILIDEYAELVDETPEAVRHADSVARRGRAVAVNLIAATQRPTQKAMGQGAVRSQMDVRICFRVRERKDIDLILGQGMLAAGWHAHTLNAPGKFLISAAEHDTPRRARAYLLTDQAVAETASRYADLQPPLDPISAAALGASTGQEPADPGDGQDGPDAKGWHGGRHGPADPETLLRDALASAPEEGISVADLMRVTGMGRSWVYYRLADLAAAGLVIQATRGCWRANPEAGNHA
jgi:hypothetical protein